MSNTIPSPNMNLPIPVPGVDPGPDYANNLNASLMSIDGHNHTAGSGVQIPPAGLNINSDLTFQLNNATNLRSARFAPQAAPLSSGTDLDCLYVSGVDLYYNDGNGNQVRITQSGSVTGASGTITGLPSGTAGAAYNAVAGTFVFTSASLTAANADVASVLLRNATASSKALTLSPPAAMAANYGLTLPSLPGATSFVQLDASGNITAGPAVSGGITSSNIAAGTITGSNIAANTVTRQNQVAVGQAVSSSSGAFSTTSLFLVNVTNLSVSLTTTGRPVMLMLVPDGGSQGSIQISHNFSGAVIDQFVLCFLRAGAVIASNGAGTEYASQSTFGIFSVPPSAFQYFDVVPAGTYTYSVQVSTNSNTTLAVNNVKLVAFEL